MSRSNSSERFDSNRSESQSSHRLWADSQPTQRSGDNGHFQAGGQDKASQHLPQIEFFDSKREMGSNAISNQGPDKSDRTKPSANGQDRQNYVSRIETGKNYVEYSLNKTTGETTQINYNDKTKTTETTGTDINGKTLTTRRDTPESTNRRDVNVNGYRDITLDKKAGTITSVNYNDKTKSTDLSVVDINNGIHHQTEVHIDPNTAVRRNYTATGYVENSFDINTGVTTNRIYSNLTKTTDKIVGGRLIVNPGD